MSSFFGASPLIELSDPTIRMLATLFITANLLFIFTFRIFAALYLSLAIVVGAAEHVHTRRRGWKRGRCGWERGRSGMLFVAADESVSPRFRMTMVWLLHLFVVCCRRADPASTISVDRLSSNFRSD